MIKLKVAELVAAMKSGAVQKLLNAPKPISAAWANRHLATSCNEEHRACEEQRLEICRKWGKLPEGAREFVFPNDQARAGFQGEFDVLNEQVVELDGEPVSVSQVEGNFTENEIFVLEPFLKD